MDFRFEDACLVNEPFTSTNGDHCTHIYAYNWAQKSSSAYLAPIFQRLSQTSFKLLAWSIDPRIVKKYDLKATCIGKLALKTWGG